MNTNFLTQANVGKISNNKAAEARKEINERWENLGFTKGFNGYLKDTMSILFENQASELLREATDSSNSGSFETVVFPLVRRVFSRLLANDIVSVQAMNMPIGKLFFFLPVTSQRSWEKDAEGNWEGSHYGLMGYERTDRRTGEKVNRYYLPDEVVNVDASGKTPEVVQYMKKSLYDLFYNDGLFDHSKGKIHINTSSDVKAASFYFTGDMLTTGSKLLNGEEAKVEIPTNTIDDTVRNVVLEVGGFASYNAGKLIGPDGNEMDTEAFLASLRVVVAAESGITSTKVGDVDTAEFKSGENVHYRCVTQRYGNGLVEYGNPCDAEGKIYIELDLAKPTKKVHQTMDGFVGVDPSQVTADKVAELFTVAWAQYDSLELETELGEVSFKLSDVTVSVEERKLRATWSPEMAQDVAAFHNIDAEAELTAILSEQIAAEIDREILRDLRHGAPWQLRWDYNGWRRQMAFSTNYTQKDWNQTFMTLINQISAQIHKAVLMGGANFVVVSTEISAMLNDLEYIHVTDANAEAVNYSLGIEKVGSLQGRYTVYVDPYAPTESCILGHKGNSLLDTGYIYAPYVPMQLTPTINNAENFAPVKGIITRYAKKMVNNRFYGAIVCSGLQTWNIMELR